MIEAQIKADIKAAEKALGALKKQVPYAASVAMNATAEDIQTVEKAGLRRDLDQPTPSTVSGIRVWRSNKRNLTAAVYVVSHINKFLRYQIEGGVRPPRKKVEAVPVQIKLNRYGNIPRRRYGKLQELLQSHDTFSGVVGGVAGIWKKVGSKGRQRLKLLVAYEAKTKYKPRFDFYGYAERTAGRRWPLQFRRAITKALATAR